MSAALPWYDYETDSFGVFCSSFMRMHTFAGPAEEENEQDEYECITGLLDELGDQMGRYVTTDGKDG